MDVASITIGRTGVLGKGAAAVVQRVSPQPRRNWLSRLIKAVADFFRGRRFARNRGKPRPPSEKSKRGAGG